MSGFALTFRLVPGEEPRRVEFDNRTAALGFRYGVNHWACEVSEVFELDRPPFAWFRPGAGAPVLETVPVAPRDVPADCDGYIDCEAVVHIHGCFADNGRNCDHPSEHSDVPDDEADDA